MVQSSETPVASRPTDGRLIACIADHPGIERAAVTSWTDPDGATKLVAYVVPSGGATPAAHGPDDQLDRWEHLWSMLYRQEDAPDPAFDIRGWNSSYTRRPLPAEEMRDWVDETVRAVGELGELGGSVLEIGCGSGLLLYRLAPHCRRYLATDFSAAAVGRLQRQAKDHGLGDIVEAREGAAHDWDGIPSDFDLVIVNSVVQYFPSPGYLDDVVREAVAHTRPGGRVFLGDTYHLSLREAMQTSIVAEQATAGTPREALRCRVLHRIASQTELLVDPAYFARVAARSDDVTAVRAIPKFGAYENEMTSFRYDAVLAVGGTPEPALDIPWYNWRGDSLDTGRLQSLLEDGAHPGFGVSGIPNARVTSWLHLWSELNGGEPAGREPGMSTDDLRRLTAGTAHELHLSCLSAHPDGSMDAAWLPTGSGGRPRFPEPPSDRHRLTNDPRWARATEGLVRDLRKHVRDTFEGSAVPMTVVCVEELPPALDVVPESVGVPS